MEEDSREENAEGTAFSCWLPVVDKLRTYTDLDPKTAELLLFKAASRRQF
jgi:uncharacterized membrane protein